MACMSEAFLNFRCFDFAYICLFFNLEAHTLSSIYISRLDFNVCMNGSLYTFPLLYFQQYRSVLHACIDLRRVVTGNICCTLQ